jgi:hypothetical protein
MLKYLAIFAVLLAVAQAPMPIPRQAADNSAGGSHQSSKQKTSEDAHSNSGVPPLSKIDEGKGAENGQQPTSKNDDQAVTISKFPHVSVAKDWADWAYWGFGGLHLIVGALQAWFLWSTLRAIQVQAGHMERQTKILEESVAAAQEAANAAIAQVEAAKSVQRAQLRVEFARPDFSYDAEAKGYPVHFRVTLDGTTRAYVFQDSILAYLSESKRTGTMTTVFGIPRYLIPEKSPYEGHTLIHDTERFPEPETDMNKFHVARMGIGKLTLFVEGSLWYRDIFGDEWILEIDRYWDAPVQSWGPVGSGQGDTHRKVERKVYSQKPN